MVQNLFAMWETWVWFLGHEDLLEKGKSTHSRGASWATTHGVVKTKTRQSNFHFTVLREGQGKCSGHMKKRDLCLQEDSGGGLWLGLAVVSWGLAMCIRGKAGRASTGWRVPGVEDLPSAPWEQEVPWSSMKARCRIEKHQETSWKEVLAGSWRTWNTRIRSFSSRHRKVFELGSEQGSYALGPLKRQPGVV